MSSGNHIRLRSMNPRVDGKGGGVDRIISSDDFALVIDQNQVEDANLPKMHTKRIDPEMLGVLRIAGRDMSGNAFVESKPGKQAKRSGQPLLAVEALFLNGGKSRAGRHVFRSSRSFGFGHTSSRFVLLLR